MGIGLLRRGLLVGALVLVVSAGAARAADGSFNLAVVDVSKVFRSYEKVQDVQTELDQKFAERMKELNAEFKKLQEEHTEIKNMRTRFSADNDFVFDKNQKWERTLFQFDKKRAQVNRDRQEQMSQQMKTVLNEIRASIRKVAESRNFQMVLRAPDADALLAMDEKPESEEHKENEGDGDPTTEEKAKKQAEEIQNILRPRSTFELVSRVRRNPVVYGSNTVDITDDVLKLLNEDYKKQKAAPK